MIEDKKVLLSIITPCFNSVKYIEACVVQLSNQTVQGVEHIIVDGGSTDGTVEKLAALNERFPHLKVLSEKDRGQSDAMNKGIRISVGDYISFLNVDDYYETDAISFAVNYLKEYPKTIALVGNCNVRLSDGTLFYVNQPSRLLMRHIASGTSFPVNPSAYFYRRDTHDILGGYDQDNHYNMDLDWLLRLSQAYTLTYVDKILGNFILVEDSKTNLDQSTGSAEQRKQEVLAHFVSKLSARQRALIWLTKFTHSVRIFSRSLARKVSLPIRMIRDKIFKMIRK